MAKNYFVLHYCHEFSPVSQTFIYDLVEKQASIGIECSVCTKRKVNLAHRSFDDVIEVGYSRLISPSRLRAAYDIPFVYGLFSNYKLLAKTLLKLNPRVIHCHFGWSAIDVLESMCKYKIFFPVLISLHGTDVNTFPKISRRYKKLLCSYNKSPIMFTVPSSYLKNRAVEMLSLKPKNIRVVPNTFNQELFIEDYSRKEVSGKMEIRLACVARFIKCKGHNLLLNVVEKLVSLGFDVKVDLVGDGPERSFIESRVATKKLTNHFHFLGSLQHQEISAVLRSCDMYIQPSIEDRVTGQAESFGVSALEAVAVGLPVIVTDVGGLPETLLGGDDVYYQVVTPSVSGIVAAIIQLTNLDRCFDNSIGRGRILEEFSHTKNMKLFSELYQELQL